MAKGYSDKEKEMIVHEVCRRMLEYNQSVRTILGTKEANIKFPASEAFYKWLHNNEKLYELYAHAKKIQSDMMDDEILQIADNKKGDTYKDEKGTKRPNPVAVQRAKLRIDARNTLKAQRQPKKYGSKVDLTSDGEQIIPQINIGNLDLSAIKGLKK